MSAIRPQPQALRPSVALGLTVIMMDQFRSPRRHRSLGSLPECSLCSLPEPSGSSTTTVRANSQQQQQHPLHQNPDDDRILGRTRRTRTRRRPRARAMPSSVPSLSSDAASITSSSSSSLSLDTGWASGLANHILEDDGSGALVVPLPPPAPSPPPPPLSVSSSPAAIATTHPHAPRRRYLCLFPVLDCHDAFDDVAQWKTHVLSHFRTHAPPPTARCPLCPSQSFVDAPDEAEPQPRAWDRLLDHVDHAHYRRGQTLAGSRPDFALMQYLYGRRIISVDQFKGMQMSPAPSSPAYHQSQESVRRSVGSADEPYCAPYSRRREERLRSQQRGVSVI